MGERRVLFRARVHSDVVVGARGGIGSKYIVYNTRVLHSRVCVCCCVRFWCADNNPRFGLCEFMIILNFNAYTYNFMGVPLKFDNFFNPMLAFMGKKLQVYFYCQDQCELLNVTLITGLSIRVKLRPRYNILTVTKK